MGERKITQYENLILPGANGVSGEYFPANHYQAENQIILRATDSIVTTQPITIHSGANYLFIAGNSIDLGPDFHVEEGAIFEAKIEPQKKSTKDSTTLEQQLIGKLDSIKLPEYKKFNLGQYLQNQDNIQVSEVYPNPNNGNFYFEIQTSGTITDFQIRLANTQGMTIYTEKRTVNKFDIINIDKQNLQKGMYILTITSDKISITRKVVIN